MCTMTIHANDVFADALRAYAAHLGKSVNQAVQELLAPTLGLAAAAAEPENPFLSCCGVVSGADGKSLRKTLSAHRKVDAELWK